MWQSMVSEVEATWAYIYGAKVEGGKKIIEEAESCCLVEEPCVRRLRGR